MAVNKQKFLPPPKGGSIVKVNTSIVKNSSSVFLSERLVRDIGVFKIKVIKIGDILKGTLASDKKRLNEQKKQESSKRREKIEEKLETKPKVENGKVSMPKLPRMGFLDWVKNFIGNVILGYFAVRLIDHLPKIIPIVKFLGNATDFVLGVGGKLLDGLVTFIDWGYKAYDATRGFIKNIFDESGVKQFDQLSSSLNQFLNLAIIAGMVVAGSSARGLGGPGGGSASSVRSRPGQGGRPKVTTSGGGRAGGIDIRNPLRQRPKVTVGRGGNRALLSSVRPFLKRIPLPVVGALVDFGLSVALGENPGRAAFRAIGAGLLGAVGAAAGTVVPVAGNFIGGLLGGVAGDAIGGVLYDFFFGSGMPSGKGKIVKKAGGGITRGGRPQRGVKRTVSKRVRYRRKLSPQKPGDVEATSPGADVGGEEKLFGLFPNPLKFLQKAVDVMNPFKVIQRAGQNLGDSDYFGPILAITSKILLGQKPSQQDYKNVGLGINMLVAKGIDDGKLKGGIVAAFAEGGFVDPKTLDAISQGGDISDWVSKSFKDATETNAQKTLREIQENLKLRKEGAGPDKSDPTEQIDEGPFEGGAGGKWGPLLDLIAGKESGGNYEAMYPSTVLKGATKMTIAEVARRATGAVGKYQQLPQYLVGRAKAAGLNPDKDLYSPENQDLIITKVNIEGNRGGRRWLRGEISDEQFMQGLSQEFASLPNAQGKFYYPGQRSSMTADKVKSALSAVKKGGYTARSSGSRGGYEGERGNLGGAVAEYITGDPNTPFGRFDRGGHGLPSNYHDHIAFRDRNTAVRAYKFFQSKGIQVTEFQGFDRVGGHAPGSYHYSGLAFDVPGAQWGGSGAIGARDYAGSAKVRKTLKEFLGGSIAKFEKGGMTLGRPHLALVGEKGKEFVIDADSTAAIEGTFPGFLGALNEAKYTDAINVLSNFASYESGSEQTVVIVDDLVAPTSGASDYGTGGYSSSLISSSGENEIDPFDSLYVGG